MNRVWLLEWKLAGWRRWTIEGAFTSAASAERACANYGNSLSPREWRMRLFEFAGYAKKRARRKKL